jgi:hypothetical protein
VLSATTEPVALTDFNLQQSLVESLQNDSQVSSSKHSRKSKKTIQISTWPATNHLKISGETHSGEARGLNAMKKIIAFVFFKTFPQDCLNDPISGVL